MALKQYPTIPANLLEALKERFPDRIPSAPVSQAEMGVLVGEQKVIRALQAEYDRQNGTNRNEQRLQAKGG